MPEITRRSPDLVRDAVMALIGQRAPDATVCPSEVARTLVKGSDPESWRDAMPAVHADVDRLMADGMVRLSWKGAPLAARNGPYRIRCASSD